MGYIEQVGDKITWYSDAGLKLREDVVGGTTIYGSDGSTIKGVFSSGECSVSTDTSNYVKFTATGLTLKSGGNVKFSFGNTGVCLGSNGTKTYTLDPADLKGDAKFKDDVECPDGSAISVLKSAAS